MKSSSSVDQENFEKLKDAYDACMDEDVIKRAGVAPLMKILDEIASLFPTQQIAFLRSALTSKDADEMADTILYLAELGIPALISSRAGADDRDPDTVVVQVSSPWRIGLPAKDYYTDDSILKKYEEALVLVMAALYPDQKDARDLAVFRTEAKSQGDRLPRLADSGGLAVYNNLAAVVLVYAKQ